MLISEDKTLDKRIKLLQEDKESIIFLHKEYGYSKRFLAKTFGVSRQTVINLINPEPMRLYKLYNESIVNREKATKREKKARERRKLLKENGIL